MDETLIEKVYTFIEHHIEENTYSPSIREIADGCLTNRSGAVRCLDILQAQGRISRERGKARCIRLLKRKN